jgi:hypothetical protein
VNDTLCREVVTFVKGMPQLTMPKKQTITWVPLWHSVASLPSHVSSSVLPVLERAFAAHP